MSYIWQLLANQLEEINAILMLEERETLRQKCIANFLRTKNININFPAVFPIQSPSFDRFQRCKLTHRLCLLQRYFFPFLLNYYHQVCIFASSRGYANRWLLASIWFRFGFFNLFHCNLKFCFRYFNSNQKLTIYSMCQCV